jgi:hypothetical protein
MSLTERYSSWNVKLPTPLYLQPKLKKSDSYVKVMSILERSGFLSQVSSFSPRLREISFMITGA